MTWQVLFAAAGVGLWLFVLTAVVIALAREHISLRAQLRVAEPISGNASIDLAPALGAPLPDALLERHGHLRKESHLLLFLSPSCVPCAQLAELLTVDPPGPATSVVIAGEPAGSPLGRWISELEVVAVGAQGSEVAQAVGVRAMPFVLTLQDGVVTGHAPVGQPEDFLKFIQSVSNGGKSGGGTASVALPGGSK